MAINRLLDCLLNKFETQREPLIQEASLQKQNFKKKQKFAAGGNVNNNVDNSDNKSYDLNTLR